MDKTQKFDPKKVRVIDGGKGNRPERQQRQDDDPAVAMALRTMAIPFDRALSAGKPVYWLPTQVTQLATLGVIQVDSPESVPKIISEKAIPFSMFTCMLPPSSVGVPYRVGVYYEVSCIVDGDKATITLTAKDLIRVPAAPPVEPDVAAEPQAEPVATEAVEASTPEGTNEQ